MSSRHVACVVSLAVAGAIVPVVVALPAVASAACIAGTENDFNGDGLSDLVISDPQATVDGVFAAGAVHVVYGGGKGADTISQASGLVTASPEEDDRFGHAVDSYDMNADGCSDLVVGAPYESVGAMLEAGMVFVFPGSPITETDVNGGVGVRVGTSYAQDDAAIPGSSEDGDQFGYAIEADNLVDGTPFLLVGSPGENLSGIDSVGVVDYLRGSSVTRLQQGEYGYPGIAEVNDRFGHAIAATSRHFAVGSPGETIDGFVWSGQVDVFSHTLLSGRAKSLGAYEQNSDGITGGAEAYDYFDKSISMASFIPEGQSAAALGSLIAIGVPGEALNSNQAVAAGRVVVLEVSSTDVVSERMEIHQGLSDVDGSPENDDHFGERVQLVNRTPAAAATWSSVLLAVGVPGEDVGTGANQGDVQIFSLIGAPGEHDAFFAPGLVGVAYSPGNGDGIGESLSSSKDYLYVGSRSGQTAVYAVPWENLVTATPTTPAFEYRPGTAGLPIEAVTLGWSLR